MSDALVILISTIIGGILYAVLGPVVVSRFSKTKKEKDLDMTTGYIRLIDLSAEQIERYINLVNKLDKRQEELEKALGALEVENNALGRQRAERDDRILSLEEKNDALHASIAGLRKQIEIDTAVTERLRGEVHLLRKQVAEGELRYKALKGYALELLAALKEGKEPPSPPPDLSDSITGWKYPK
jgi:septal ring factor EnvC (AmiA/AmiB activator)